jgi:hypothetical protein
VGRRSRILKKTDPLTMNAPFEIDRETGTLHFPHLALTLAPKQELAHFLATGIAARAKKGFTNQEWQWYLLRQNIGDGQGLWVSLGFSYDWITQVSFGYGPESEWDWSKWSKEKELARSDEYQRELERQLGSRGQFPWGIANAGYDDKAASAEIFVRYDWRRLSALKAQHAPTDL